MKECADRGVRSAAAGYDPAAWPEGVPPTVLIVEDDDGVRGFLTFALESGGYAALGVRTGEEAMTELHRTAASGHPHRRHPARHARHPPRSRDPRGARARARRHQLRDRRHSRRPARRSRCRRAEQAAPRLATSPRPSRRCSTGATRAAARCRAPRGARASSNISSSSAPDRRCTRQWITENHAMSESRTLSLLPWQVTLDGVHASPRRGRSGRRLLRLRRRSVHPAGGARRLRVARDGLLASRRAGVRPRRRRRARSRSRGRHRLGERARTARARRRCASSRSI